MKNSCKLSLMLMTLLMKIASVWAGVSAYTYPMSYYDVPNVAEKLPDFVEDVYMKLGDIATPEAGFPTEFRIKNADGFYPQNWMGSTNPNFIGLINSPPDYDLTANTAADVISSLAGSGWENYFNAIHLDTEPNTVIAGDRLSFYTAIADYVNNTMNMPLNIYVNPNCIDSTTQGLANIDALETLLAGNDENYIVIPTYEELWKSKVAHVENLQGRDINFRFAVEVSMVGETAPDTSEQLNAITPFCDAEAYPNYDGLCLYQIKESVALDQASVEEVEAFYDTNIPEPATMFLLAIGGLMLSSNRRRR